MPFIRNVLLLTYLWICYFNICIQSLSSSVSINNAQASIFFSVQMQKGLTLISEKPDYTSFRHAVALKLFPPKEESVFDFFLYSCCCCFFSLEPCSLICLWSLWQVIKEPNLKVFFTPDERYTVKKSFYSPKISTINSSIPDSQYLTITVDADQKRRLEQQIKVKGYMLGGRVPGAFHPAFSTQTLPLVLP